LWFDEAAPPGRRTAGRGYCLDALLSTHLRPGGQRTRPATGSAGRTRADGISIGRLVCSLAGSEQLVLAAEHVTDRAVGEDLADRVGQQVRAGEDADVVGSAGRQRQGV